MYVVKIRVSGRLSEILTQGRGRFVRTAQGDICVFRSLTVATEVAKLLAGYGLLGWCVGRRFLWRSPRWNSVTSRSATATMRTATETCGFGSVLRSRLGLDFPAPQANGREPRDGRAAELPAANGITNARSLARVFAAPIGPVDRLRYLSRRRWIVRASNNGAGLTSWGRECGRAGSPSADSMVTFRGRRLHGRIQSWSSPSRMLRTAARSDISIREKQRWAAQS